MPAYKDEKSKKWYVSFYVNSRANIYSTNAEVIDLVEDWKRMDQ